MRDVLPRRATRARIPLQRWGDYGTVDVLNQPSQYANGLCLNLMCAIPTAIYAGEIVNRIARTRRARQPLTDVVCETTSPIKKLIGSTRFVLWRQRVGLVCQYD